MSRDEFFAGLYILGCTGGLGAQAMLAVHREGWSNAAFNTFGISAIVWIACVLAVRALLADRSDTIRPADLAVGTVVILVTLLPSAGASWVGVAALSLYLLVFCRGAPRRTFGALILLAVTLPMLWTRLLLDYFPGVFLNGDAALVAWTLGTQQAGNLVRLFDGSGNLLILPPCASLTNTALAFLGWLTLTQTMRPGWSTRTIAFGFLACASVVGLNVARLSFMGLSEWHYHAIHNQWGDLVVEVLMLALALGCGVLGIGREAVSRP